MLSRLWIVCAWIGGMALSGCSHVVVVESTPPGARVFYDGEDKGLTPVEIREGLFPNPHAALEVTSGDARVRAGVERQVRIDPERFALAGALLLVDGAMLAVPLLVLSQSSSSSDPLLLAFAPLLSLGPVIAVYAFPLVFGPLAIGQPRGPDRIHVDLQRGAVTTSPATKVVVHGRDDPPPPLASPTSLPPPPLEDPADAAPR